MKFDLINTNIITLPVWGFERNNGVVWKCKGWGNRFWGVRRGSVNVYGQRGISSRTNSMWIMHVGESILLWIKPILMNLIVFKVGAITFLKISLAETIASILLVISLYQLVPFLHHKNFHLVHLVVFFKFYFLFSSFITIINFIFSKLFVSILLKINLN